MTNFEILFDNLFIYMGGDDEWYKVGKRDAEFFMEKVLELEQDRREWKHSQEAYKEEAEASRVHLKKLGSQKAEIASAVDDMVRILEGRNVASEEGQ